MDAWTFDSRGPEETFAFGRALGQSVGAEGLAIALVGPLGAGSSREPLAAMVKARLTIS